MGWFLQWSHLRKAAAPSEIQHCLFVLLKLYLAISPTELFLNCSLLCGVTISRSVLLVILQMI